MKHFPVALDHCEKFDWESEYTGYSYQIFVSRPVQPPPEDGYPIIYVLDGLSYFQYAHNVIALQSKNALKTHIAPALIIGIGHAEKDMRSRRFYDFTAPADAYVYPERLQGRTLGVHGGAEDFYRFIEEELKPYIESVYQVNQERQSLFGHSLGGYFALWAMLTKPASFQAYLACSPSIWWNGYELTRYASHYLHKELASKPPKLFLAAGEKEGFMAEDAIKMGQTLAGDHNSCEWYIAPEENHASVVPAIISRAFRFALSENPAEG